MKGGGEIETLWLQAQKQAPIPCGGGGLYGGTSMGMGEIVLLFRVHLNYIIKSPKNDLSKWRYFFHNAVATRNIPVEPVNSLSITIAAAAAQSNSVNREAVGGCWTFVSYLDIKNLNCPPPFGVMGCGVTEATGPGFVCFVVISQQS